MRLEAITTMTDPVLSSSDEIDAIINGLDGWRAEVLATLRQLIHDADPAVVEEIKWRKPSNHRGVPVWSHTEMICTGEANMDKVKLTFARGASLPDPVQLFTSSLGGAPEGRNWSATPGSDGGAANWELLERQPPNRPALEW